MSAVPTTLEEYCDAPVSSQRYISLPARIGRNLGYPSFTTTLDIGMLLDQTRVGNDAAAIADPTGDGLVTQRPLNLSHATKMAVFNLSSLLSYMERTAARDPNRVLPDDAKKILEHVGRQEYYSWAPIVCSVRSNLSEIKIRRADYYGHDGNPVNTDERVIDLKSDTTIWVVDGQHRRYGFQLVSDWLKKIIDEGRYPRVKDGFPKGLPTRVPEGSVAFWREVKRALWHEFTVSVELHFGLSAKQERQLFYFLNDLSRAVPAAISHSFDSGNAINRFTSSLLESGVIPKSLIETATQINWDDTSWLRLDSLNSINARMFLNTTSMDNAKATTVSPRLDAGTKFWKAVMQIPNITDRKKSVAAQPAMLKSIARAYYDLCWGRNHATEEVADSFLAKLPSLDFSHTNTLWHLDKNAIAANSELEARMPENWKTKVVGSLDSNNCFRYDSRHNEILILLAPILRYMTGTAA